MNSKWLKISLIAMLAVSVLFFWHLWNIANTLDLLNNIKTLTSKPDPLWFMKSTISSIVNNVLSLLKKILGLV
nr:hypothetical protein [Candidatus Freyarchaeota archaeon]